MKFFLRRVKQHIRRCARTPLLLRHTQSRNATVENFVIAPFRLSSHTHASLSHSPGSLCACVHDSRRMNEVHECSVRDVDVLVQQRSLHTMKYILAGKIHYIHASTNTCAANTISSWLTVTQPFAGAQLINRLSVSFRPHSLTQSHPFENSNSVLFRSVTERKLLR